MDKYLSGEVLYGDDFNTSEISDWFKDEKVGYFELAPRDDYSYVYHARNWIHGFRHLPKGSTFTDVLGIGAAFGDELRPILNHCTNVTILEPAHGFHNNNFRYIEPRPTGEMPFESKSFDLVTCLGVLHHIPNVSTVMREISRVVKPAGYVLITDPIISMGDWTKPRKWLTRRERGIPIHIFRSIIAQTDLGVVRETRCHFSVTRHIIPNEPFNKPWVVRLDALLCRIPVWTSCYHPKNKFQKIRPSAVFYVLQKRR